jgi:transcription elongation factor GreA
MPTNSTWVPPLALKALTEELADLSSHPHPDDAAKQRMREVRQLLRQAEAAPKPDDGIVEPGMRVTAVFGDDDRSTVFVLGDRTLAALDLTIETPVYSPSSALGAAIIGARAGDTVRYDAPSGRPITVEILAAAPYLG